MNFFGYGLEVRMWGWNVSSASPRLYSLAPARLVSAGAHFF